MGYPYHSILPKFIIWAPEWNGMGVNHCPLRGQNSQDDLFGPTTWAGGGGKSKSVRPPVFKWANQSFVSSVSFCPRSGTMCLLFLWGYPHLCPQWAQMALGEWGGGKCN